MNRSAVIYLISLSVLALFAAFFSGVLFYLQYTSYFEKSLENNLRSTTMSILRLYDFSDLEGLKQAGFDREPEYFDMLEELDVYREEFGFAYIYALQKNRDGEYVFVFDTANLDEDSSEWSFGESYTDYPAVLPRALAEEQILFSETYTDRWGTFRSIFAPLYNARGDVTGVLGLDYEMSLIEGFDRKARRGLFLSLAVGFVLTLMLGRILSKAVTNPFEQARIDADKSRESYRGLFDESPVALWEEDFSEVREYTEGLKASGITDFLSYFEKHPGELKKCLAKIRIIDVNPTAVRLMGVEDKEVLLGRIWDLPNVKVSNFFAQEIAGVGNGLYHQNWEAEIYNGANRKLNIMFNWSVPENSRSDYSRVIIGMTDLTEMKEIQNRLQQSGKMHAIGQLAGGIAHDFNNILVGIMGYTELSLVEAGEEGKIPEYLNNILAAAKRARDLVSRILSFSKKSEKTFSIVALAPLILEVGALLKATLPSSISLELDVPDDEALTVSGVSSEIHEIIMNLASNAAQAMSDKGRLSIRLKAASYLYSEEGLLGVIEAGDYALIEVIDSGEGIPSGDLNRIFEPFYTTKMEKKGTGLGLSIVYSLVENQGGNIRISSVKGEGTEFGVLLPLATVPPGE